MGFLGGDRVLGEEEMRDKRLHDPRETRNHSEVVLGKEPPDATPRAAV